MSELTALGAQIDWPDSAAGTMVRDRLVARPGLGRLAALAEWVAEVRPPGSQFSRVRALIVGAEPDELIADTAVALDAEVRGLPAEGTATTGAELADEAIDRGSDLLIVAVPNLGADAAVAVAVLTNTEPVKVLSRGVAATDPQAWMRMAIQVRDTRRRVMPVRDDPDKLLAEIGSPRLAVAAGLVLQAAARRTPVVLDGPVAAAAALIAYEAHPRAVRWWSVADVGSDPMHELALTRLGQRAILGLGTGLGDGLAGLLALPVVRAAARLADMGLDTHRTSHRSDDAT